MGTQTSQATTVGDEIDMPAFDLSSLPPVFVLPLRLNSDQLLDTEDALTKLGAPLTYDVSEAQIFIGKVAQKRRALFELRNLKVQVEEIADLPSPTQSTSTNEVHPGSRKRRRGSGPVRQSVPVVRLLDDSSTESDPDEVKEDDSKVSTATPIIPIETKVADDALGPLLALPNSDLLMVSLAWLEKSMSAREMLPIQDYIVLKGRRVQEPTQVTSAKQTTTSSTTITSPIVPTRSSGLTTSQLPSTSPHSEASILSRARDELGPDRGQTSASWASSSQQRRSGHSTLSHARTSNMGAHIPALIHQTTSEHDMAVPHDFPQPPEWVINRSKYSCERSTPLKSPNEAFIEQLKIIRLARKLTDDEIGVRAYSTSIASISAYPHAIHDSREVLALPGCEGKIAALWAEWHEKISPDQHEHASSSDATAANESILITAAREAEDDPKLQVLRLFYEIWGVGDKTARDFYNNGWRELDDVVEFGWSQLSRVQQIGVKYYDEFQQKIPRAEVESIAGEIHRATQRVCRDGDGVRSCIVGGYRRGKVQSGDVDVIVSHVDESQTIDLIQEIVKELVDRGWITHELSTTLTGSRRGQATLPFRNAGGGHGFDTLDKALVVWQDPNWHGRKDLPKDATADDIRRGNPNVHRRVDIIIAPWSKIGCAVLGWSAGTTFERDLRRYAKARHNWKFDSSGIRDRATGLEVDLESKGGQSQTPEEAEKKVFEGLGLVYREPWERCTG